MQDNLKILLKYLVDSFWDELVKFEKLTSIHSLKIKYEQVLSIPARIFHHRSLESDALLIIGYLGLVPRLFRNQKCWRSVRRP